MKNVYKMFIHTNTKIEKQNSVEDKHTNKSKPNPEDKKFFSKFFATSHVEITNNPTITLRLEKRWILKMRSTANSSQRPFN